MDAEKLERLRELATPGPWYVRGRMLSRVPDSTGMGGTLHTNHIANFASREDCEYVHAVLAAHDALAKRVEDLEETLHAERHGMRASYNALNLQLGQVEVERDALRAKVEELQAERLLFRIERDDNAVLAHEAERERDEARAVIARVRDALSDCSLDHSLDAVSAIQAVLPKREDG